MACGGYHGSGEESYPKRVFGIVPKHPQKSRSA
jgi:hypothetical protein